MNVQVNGFYGLIEQEWNYPRINNATSKTQLLIQSVNIDVSGGVLSQSDIDILSDYPDVKSVTITGLSHDTFEYFIKKYGHQLRFIEFFKNKRVEDWAILGTLPDLEGIYWFHNQKIS